VHFCGGRKATFYCILRDHWKIWKIVSASQKALENIVFLHGVYYWKCWCAWTIAFYSQFSALNEPTQPIGYCSPRSVEDVVQDVTTIELPHQRQRCYSDAFSTASTDLIFDYCKMDSCSGKKGRTHTYSACKMFFVGKHFLSVSGFLKKTEKQATHSSAGYYNNWCANDVITTNRSKTHRRSALPGRQTIWSCYLLRHAIKTSRAITTAIDMPKGASPSTSPFSTKVRPSRGLVVNASASVLVDRVFLAGPYQDFVNWYCSLLTRRTVYGRAVGTTTRTRNKPSEKWTQKLYKLSPGAVKPFWL